MTTVSIILAAGRGSRMKGYGGNKTLLPLLPEKRPYEGRVPILLYILSRLPSGPRVIVVNHAQADVMAATRGLDLIFREQPELNGTGGALLAAEDVVVAQPFDHLIITMGDVPFVRPGTYQEMLDALKDHAMVVLGFRPRDRKQYGVLETEGDRVVRIVEWKYWSRFPEERQERLRICNSGIYAVRRDVLLHYLPVLASRPHRVSKEVDGRLKEIEEYFITDLVEIMHGDGISTGYRMAADEEEVMGIDDLAALQRAQQIYRRTLRDAADGAGTPRSFPAETPAGPGSQAPGKELTASTANSLMFSGRA